MRTPKLSKKKFEDLRKMFKEVFADIGAIIVLDDPICDNQNKLFCLDFELETSAGTLKISPYETGIHSRFVDVEAAKKILPHGYTDRLNPCSGKFNFCCYPTIIDQNEIEIFINVLEHYNLISRK